MLQFSVLYAARLCVWNKTRATCFFIIVRWKQKGNRPSAIVRNVMRAQHLEISLFQFRERAGTQLRNVNRQPVRYTELLKCCTSTFKRPVLELLIFLCMLFTLCFINQTIHNFFFYIVRVFRFQVCYILDFIFIFIWYSISSPPSSSRPNGMDTNGAKKLLCFCVSSQAHVFYIIS